MVFDAATISVMIGMVDFRLVSAGRLSMSPACLDSGVNANMQQHNAMRKQLVGRSTLPAPFSALVPFTFEVLDQADAIIIPGW